MSAPFNPRWYQTKAVKSLYDYFEKFNGNPLIAMPTGSGKSGVNAMFIQSVLSQYPNQRILLSSHVKELLINNYRALMQIWPNAPAGIYSSGLKQRDLFAPITFGGIASIVKIIEAFGHIDLFIIDECHLLGPNSDSMYMRVILALRERNPKLKVIGLTATPWRTGMGLLTNGDIFTDIAYDLCTMDNYKRLFMEGYLVKPVPKRVDNEIDVSNVAISTTGDYSQSGLNEVTRNEKITWAALNESLNKNPDRHCRLVFCTGIEHALLAAQMLKYIGLRAEAVHSKMPENDRDDIFKAFFAGELDALTNNGIATTGIDHPPIDHEIMLRPTISVGLWVQMVGRGMRPYENNGWVKENCIISDHAGNARRLGPIDDPYIPKMKGKGSGDAPVKICPACDAYNHASARVCDFCGEPFEIKIGYVPKAYDDVIIRSDLPIYETYKVDHVYYTQHLRRDATPETKPTIKAAYQCGMLRFQEFIAIEAPGYIGKKARDWWRQRFSQEGFVPTTVNDAMQYIDRLVAPKAIKVHVNKKYPEIVGYDY
jgi:DNA repair protein RadD